MQVKEFWDSRAALGTEAGTRDRIAYELEYRAIAAHVADGMAVLDVGCGNGETLLQLCRRYRLTQARGIDNSLKMLDAARANRDMLPWEDSAGPTLLCGSALDGDALGEGWDVAYTQRAIINCGDWEHQKQAIRNILAAVRPGGIYLMVENSADGLASVNAMRAAAGLPAIQAPWHNRYLVDSEVTDFECALWGEGVAELESVERIGSLYAILSRVVNAHVAALEGREPDYDSPINGLALKLPNVGNIGQYTLWKWRRLSAGEG